MTELTSNENTFERDYVFGLDIGTRNVVGTVGRMEGNEFRVLVQYSTEHETRSMIDGQIHDIGRVSHTIAHVKEKLEEKLDFKLKNVCIAAAGRVLQTVTTHVEYEYPQESIVTGEDLNTLDLLGVDQAQHELSQNNSNYKFYCVGYTVMRYYLNGEPFTSLEGHKANKIEETIIVTFLPEDVVDGLYSAVERAGLQVANLTLEPIAAINVAIPENFRMLNISLVDVGAGTSDICITKDGSIIAYGMIPFAGDEITEVIVQEYLVDFATAEQIKKDAVSNEKVTYVDIMGIEHTVSNKDVWDLCSPTLDKISTAVCDKILELNGGNSVAAVFVVGGGGKAHGFCNMISSKLGIIDERVALRGEEVMKMVKFDQDEIKKDPLLVTPIGICLNYYEQRNRFIMVRFNGEMMKLYDSGQLKIVDAALQAGLTTDEIFPQRGKEINYTVNGVKRMARGEAGESARVLMNGVEVGLNDKLEPNSEITIETSTVGNGAKIHINDLSEFRNEYVWFIVNGQKVSCPKFVEVNGQLQPGHYEICDGDVIETRAFYTVGQLAAFMDVEVSQHHKILVNNRQATMETLIYENFSVEWTVTGYGVKDGEYIPDGIMGLDDEEVSYDMSGDFDEVEPIKEETSVDDSEAEAVEEEVKAILKASDSEIDISKELPEDNEEEQEEIKLNKSVANVTEEINNETNEEILEKETSDKEINEDTSNLSLDEIKRIAANSVIKMNSLSDSKNEDIDLENEEEPAKEETESRIGIGIKSEADKDFIYYARNSSDSDNKAEELAAQKAVDIPNDVETNNKLNDSSTRNRPLPKNTGVSFDIGRAKATVSDDFTTPTRPLTPFSVDLNKAITQTIKVKINDEQITMNGKREYIFVDVYNYYDFDPEEGKGRKLITSINGKKCSFADILHDGDEIELRWVEK